jgi:AAA domain-containing protein
MTAPDLTLTAEDKAFIYKLASAKPKDAQKFHTLFWAGTHWGGTEKQPSSGLFELALMVGLAGAVDQLQVWRILEASAHAKTLHAEEHLPGAAERRAMLDAPDLPGVVTLAWAAAKAHPEASSTPPATGVTLTLAEYAKDPDAFKPPVPVIPRLAWPGTITMLASSEGWGKSTLLRAGCAAVTTGQRFLDGEPVPPDDVLWAMLEEPLATCMSGAQRFGTAGDKFTVWRNPGNDPVTELVEHIREVLPAVTVVDSIQVLATLAGVENLDNAVQVGAALEPLVQACRDTETAMVWLAQATKATGKYRNSSWFGHRADVVLDIAEPEEDSGIRKLRKEKTRVEGVRTFKVELVQSTYKVVLGDDGNALSGTRLIARDVLPGDHGLSDTAWKKACCTDMSASTYERAKGWLLAEGYVAKVGKLYQRHLA